MSFVALRERISDFKIIMVNEVKLEFKTKTVFTSGEGLIGCCNDRGRRGVD